MLPYVDLAAQARAALPADVYTYYACGAGDEVTVAANERAWAEVLLRPRVLRDVAAVDTATTLLGAQLAAPVLVAPTALHRLAHPEGEVATARGTHAAGSLLVLSTRSSVAIDEVARDAGAWWLQVYVLRDRGLTRALVEAAAAAGARALVLTGDTPYVGVKPREPRSLVVPVEWRLPGLTPTAAADGALQAPDVTEADIASLHDAAGLPVLVKGVLRADDARRCVDAGAAGVIVSNHGGRQLDGAVPTARALPEVVDAVAGVSPTADVLVDGGVRSGRDVLRALALGARAVLLGRPVLWGLAVGGAEGVQAVLTGMREDLTHAMALAGARGLAEIGPDLIWPAPRR